MINIANKIPVSCQVYIFTERMEIHSLWKIIYIAALFKMCNKKLVFTLLESLYGISSQKYQMIVQY